jgi:DNA processing protein
VNGGSRPSVRLAGLARVRAGVTRSGELDDQEVLARVAWSTVVEPGDSHAGELVGRLGAARSIRAALEALDAGPLPLGEMLVDAGARTIGDASAAACLSDDDDDACAELARAAADALVPAIDRWRPRLVQLDVDTVLHAASVVGCSLVLPGDDDWPAGLDDLGPHAPLVLWRRGSVGVDERPAVAVVGARADTVLGAEAAAEITSAAADAGCLVVSGGAYGIDAVAHRVALAAGAPTVAVLAGGVDQLYPAANTSMLRTIGERGALFAECAPGTRPSRWRFLAR